MRSRTSSLFVLLLTALAALVPGAALHVRPAFACTLIAPESPVQFVAESELVVIGTVNSVSGDAFVLEPEAFLKGPLSAEPMRFTGEDDLCPTLQVREGDRVLLYVADAARLQWPFMNMGYVLRDGKAFREGEPERTEVEVVSAIRALTNQYAVPAASEDEGAGIDWGGTILPLGGVLLVLFAIGLVLMRVWHRIDPS